MAFATAILWPTSSRADVGEPPSETQSPTPEAELKPTELQGDAAAERDAAAEGEATELDEGARRRAIRNCHTCDHGPIRFNISLPIFVPIVAMEMIPSDDSEGAVDFQSGVTFGASLGLELRTGPITTHIAALGLGLGSQRATDREGKDLAQIDFLGMLGQAYLQWNAPTIALGSASSAPRLALWPLAGVRVLVINGRVDATIQDLDETLVRVDPYLGLSSVVDFAGPWSLELGLSAGGFTLGNDISLVGELSAQHSFTHWLQLRLGYFAFYATDSDTGSALLNDYEFLMHGPLLSVRFTIQ